MTVDLLVLCLAAFTLAAALLSALLGLALPLLDELASRVTPRNRVRLWLGVAALPSVVGALAVQVSLLPAIGIGHDHCLDHGLHHPHLCPHHLQTGPGVLLSALSVLTALRLARAGVQAARTVHLSHATSRALDSACEPSQGAFVFPSTEPRAFVLGVLHPRIYLSEALLSLGDSIVEPVRAHERVHAARRDLLWRLVLPLIAIGHLPGLTKRISSRLSFAQETAADFEAAETIAGGRLAVAEALVQLAPRVRAPSPELSFTHGDLERRVRALLEEERPHCTRLGHALVLVGLAVPVFVGLAHDAIHHGLETLLGTLS